MRLSALSLLACVAISATAHAETLRLLDSGISEVPLGKAAAEKAGFTVELVALPSARISVLIQENSEPACAPGWFKNPEREQFAKFTSPIRRDPSAAVYVSSAKADVVGKHKSFASLFADTAIVAPAPPAGGSFGPFIDKLLAARGGNVEVVKSFDPQHTGKMLALDRLAWVPAVPRPEDQQKVRQELQAAGQDLVVLEMQDSPPGGLRYMMCSKSVSDDTIAKLNAAIAELYPNAGN